MTLKKNSIIFQPIAWIKCCLNKFILNISFVVSSFEIGKCILNTVHKCNCRTWARYKKRRVIVLLWIIRVSEDYTICVKLLLEKIKSKKAPLKLGMSLFCSKWCTLYWFPTNRTSSLTELLYSRPETLLEYLAGNKLYHHKQYQNWNY